MTKMGEGGKWASWGLRMSGISKCLLVSDRLGLRARRTWNRWLVTSTVQSRLAVRATISPLTLPPSRLLYKARSSPPSVLSLRARLLQLFPRLSDHELACSFCGSRKHSHSHPHPSIRVRQCGIRAKFAST